ncbi:phosphoribosyltransferase-like protein [Burkholderia vietnamiensis]|uniref:phosphoribosyltransferase-like protein n=1 Tax=Burkholderia vietnamiensis TaxID=60552 RepID=UPI001594A1B3|nr:hypothetical protein [Burkholderia vietnamiensis]
MTKLVLAVAPASCKRVEDLLVEHTAGRWRRWVTIVPLAGKKAENDSELHDIASSSNVPIFAAASSISKWLGQSHPHVRLLPNDYLLAELVRWLDDERLSWQGTLRMLRGLTGFQLGDEAVWRGQFSKIDPKIGPRVAKALLAQLRVVRINELADLLTVDGDFDFNVYFIGNDPHSGDYAMVTPLAARIDGDRLREASELPSDIADGARVRLFSDGAWSGGETEKRIRCLTRTCPNKTSFIRPTQTLYVKVGFATESAVSRIKRRGERLVRAKSLAGFELSCSNVLDAKAGLGLGLAFAEEDVNGFVDAGNPRAYYDFCAALGAQVYPTRPMGTSNIASTVAFEHSLPKAMLPLFIFGGASVKAADGTTFAWRPLLHSRHVQNPAKNKPGHHCSDCHLE